MTILAQISGFSLVLWFCVDRVKILWNKYSWGKYITLCLSIALGEVLAFGFKLDFIYGTELFDSVSIIGMIVTGIILSAGASPIAELVEMLKVTGKKQKSLLES